MIGGAMGESCAPPFEKHASAYRWGPDMTIIYPVDQRLLSGKAHDILILRTCHALAALGHTVFLVTQEVGVDVEVFWRHYGIQGLPNLHVIFIPIRQKKLGISWRFLYPWFCCLKIQALLRTVPVDLIYLSELKLGHDLLHRIPILKKPIIYEFHSLKAFEVEPFRPDAMEESVYKHATAVIATTENLLRMLKHLYGNRESQEIISLASDLFLDRFSFHPNEEGSEAKIFYLGQLYPLQGVAFLVEAMALLPGNQLHIVGGRPDEIEGLKEVARRSGTSSRVHFYGFVRPVEIPPLLRKADLLVVPSKNAGRMPYVAHTKIYEYMAYGKPIVATDLPAVREVLVDHHNAILVSPDNAKALAEGIQQVLSDPGLAKKIAQNAYETARSHTWERRGKALASFFESELRVAETR